MPMLSLRVDDETWDRINAAAGENRSGWVKRALEQALGDAKGSVGPNQAASDPVGSPEPVKAAAPARASEGPVSAGSGSGLSGADRAAAFRRAELLRRAGN